MSIQIKQVSWISDDQMADVHVKYDCITDDERCAYRWWIMQNGKILRSECDLYSGVGDDIDAMKALETFSSFISAWIEAIPNQNSENYNMFPLSLVSWVEAYGDEFVNEMMVIDED